MTANVLSRIFTIEIGDTPTLMFEAQNMREAQELCHEQWLKDDLAEAKSDGAPLWDGKAKLRVRMARLDESAQFAAAKKNGQPSDGLMLVYLVELDGPLTRSRLILAPFRLVETPEDEEIGAVLNRYTYRSRQTDRAQIGRDWARAKK